MHCGTSQYVLLEVGGCNKAVPWSETVSNEHALLIIGMNQKNISVILYDVCLKEKK